ncbi:MAG: protein translocase subunit SecD [Planctomycetes bacterium]|nr:protein translocase subunit SecD [Planctomycetota bacterium]
MNDPNRLLKWLLVLGLAVLSLVILYPPGEKLKGGIDLVGGTSLLFEIDTSGLSPGEQRGLSSRVMTILKDRVDPKGQMNLEWRPVGNARLEIRLPRPPEEAIARREQYNASLEHLAALNLSRFELESALNAGESERAAALEALKRGVVEREPLLSELVSAFSAYSASQKSEDTTAATAAAAAYEAAMAKVLATSLPLARLTDVLGLPPGEKRNAEIDKLRAEFPSYDAQAPTPERSKLITRTAQCYDRWATNKADLEDPSDLKRRIKGAGVLEFRILADRNASSPENTDPPVQPISKYVEQLKHSGPRPKSGDRYRWFAVEDILKFMHVDSMDKVTAAKDVPGQPIVEEYAGRWYALLHNDLEYGLLQSTQAGRKWKLKAAYPDVNPMTGEHVVAFTLDPRGGQMFGELTGNNVNRSLCIMLDNIAVSHANIEERITERCQIRGRFTPERVYDLVRTLEAGSLPARLKETPLSEQTIGPSLGESNRQRGVRAAVWGGLLVAAFVVFYYGLAGGSVADLALTLNLLFTLALMALMNATFTLPGIAGLILTVGMAVDANVLIFERIREERARGVIFKKALNAGYDRAFSTIFDSNLTTLISCVILGFVGSEEIKGFAIALGLGLVTSMFTALTITRLIFNTLIAKGWLHDLSMRKLIGIPSIDWVGLRRIFWPVSTVVVTCGISLFLGKAYLDPESIFDIEFLGGTSVQVDLKPGVTMSDDEVRQAITSAGGSGQVSAVQWLNQAAEHLASAEAAGGATVGQFTLTSPGLSGDQIAALTRQALENSLERDGIQGRGHTVTYIAKAGELDIDGFKAAVARAAQNVRDSANRLRGARVQSVGEPAEGKDRGVSYEVVTIETNRGLVQAALMAALGDRLDVQRSIDFTATRDEELTREPFFVVETDDQYLSDVIGGDAHYDVRRFRGGVAVEVALGDTEEPIAVETITKRLREVGLQPEFEQYRSRESTVLPLGAPAVGRDGATGYRRFAICAIDESLLYDDDPVQWTDGMARTTLAQVEAALGREKALSKVVQFAPQIAGQTKNRALFATILSLIAIGAYVWLRFGNKEFGLAVIVCLVHDVAVTLGMVAASHWLYSSFIGRPFLVEDFRLDLSVVAAVLTIVGYSLNDTIVVFDRIRENRGRAGTLSGSMINTSINQTMSRTLLTSLTVFIAVFVLYVFGGAGVHAFSYAMLVGVISGTYSTVGIAVPLVHRPRTLHNVTVVLVVLLLLGLIASQVPNLTAQIILALIVVAGGVTSLSKSVAAARLQPA